MLVLLIAPGGKDVPIDARVMVWTDDNSNVTGVFVRVEGGAAIVTERRDHRSDRDTVMVLTPKQPLAPNTRYEVVVARGRNKPHFQQFTTGTARAPGRLNWQAAATDRVALIKPPYHAGTCLGRSALFVELDLLAEDSPGLRVVGVWVGPKPDYTSPPSYYLTGPGTRLRLGRGLGCGSSNLTLPPTGTLVLGFKLIDIAGNASDAREVTVDMTTPQQEPRW